jgi:hypothetical protein
MRVTLGGSRPSKGFSQKSTPSHAPEDDDDPDDVQLNPQTTEVSNNSGGSYATPVTSRPQRARKPMDLYTPVQLAAAQSSNYDSRSKISRSATMR